VRAGALEPFSKPSLTDLAMGFSDRSGHMPQVAASALALSLHTVSVWPWLVTLAACNQCAIVLLSGRTDC
jgi:hypothetical protein